MWITLLPALFGLIDKVIPDANAAAAAKLKAMELQSSKEGAELEAATRLALAQIDVNKADAAGTSIMQRNWRPFIGWVCGAALAWDTLAKPVMLTVWAMAGHAAPILPTLADNQLYGLLFGLLGLGAMRTVEKVKGAA